VLAVEETFSGQLAATYILSVVQGQVRSGWVAEQLTLRYRQGSRSTIDPQQFVTKISYNMHCPNTRIPPKDKWLTEPKSWHGTPLTLTENQTNNTHIH
jgi:hypothetical protein